jgi:glycosyltransferase involved in cell wall biosynthesis
VNTPNPELSIITISYGDPEGLRRTLESLRTLVGSELSWEHVVVDSSPEINAKILSDFKTWPLVRIESSPLGIYPAFNLGLQKAQGEFVWFLNGGDRLKNIDNLKALMSIASKNPTTDLFCAGVNVFRDMAFTYPVYPKEPLLKNLIGQNTLCHQGVIYRKSVFTRVGLYSETYKLAGDYEHHLRCFFQGVTSNFSKIIIAEFDRDGRSDTFEKVFSEYKKIWEVYRPKFSTSMTLRNKALGLAHLTKLRLMRSSFIKPVSKPLKKLWYRFKSQ